MVLLTSMIAERSHRMAKQLAVTLWQPGSHAINETARKYNVNPEEAYRDWPAHLYIYFFFFFFCFSGPHPRHMESSQARSWIGAAPASLHYSHSNAGSLTHWGRPGMEPASSWILVRLLSAAPQQELPPFIYSFIKILTEEFPLWLSGNKWY